MTSEEIVDQLVNIILNSESEEGQAYPDELDIADERLRDDIDDDQWHGLLREPIRSFKEGEDTFPLLAYIESKLPTAAKTKLAEERTLYRMSLGKK